MCRQKIQTKGIGWRTIAVTKWAQNEKKGLQMAIIEKITLESVILAIFGEHVCAPNLIFLCF